MTSWYSIQISYPPDRIVFSGYFSVINDLVTNFYDSANSGVDICLHNEDAVFLTNPYHFSSGGIHITSIPFLAEEGESPEFYNLYFEKDIPHVRIHPSGRDLVVHMTFAKKNDPTCFLRDCDILLANYVVKNITELTVYDRVLGYFSNEPQTIVQIYKQTHKLSSLPEDNKPFLIAKDTFGVDSPNKDMHLSGYHKIIIQKEDSNFEGKQTFELDGVQTNMRNDFEVDYYHIVLENKGECIIVNGLPVESCLE